MAENSKSKNDEYFMRQAIKEARKAEALDEVPIGAVLVHDGKILARGHNLREKKQSSLAHAEIVAIESLPENRILASGRLCPLRYAGTLPDVRRGDSSVADRKGGIRRCGSEGRKRRNMFLTFMISLVLIIIPKCWAEC